MLCLPPCEKIRRNLLQDNNIHLRKSSPEQTDHSIHQWEVLLTLEEKKWAITNTPFVKKGRRTERVREDQNSLVIPKTFLQFPWWQPFTFLLKNSLSVELSQMWCVDRLNQKDKLTYSVAFPEIALECICTYMYSKTMESYRNPWRSFLTLWPFQILIITKELLWDITIAISKILVEKESVQLVISICLVPEQEL